MISRNVLLETTSTAAGSSDGSPSFPASAGGSSGWNSRRRRRWSERLAIEFDRLYFWICVAAVKLCIFFRYVPGLNSMLRRLTLMSGSFDTNAMLCLFLRYLYTFLPRPTNFDEAERVFARLFLEKQYFIFAWVANSLTMRLLPPLIRPLYRSYYGRAKFATEFVERSIIDRNALQLVVLGAGFDSTAYRTASVRKERGVRVFEVDLPRVQRMKLKIMRRGLPKSQLQHYQHQVVYVECDFGRNDLTETLLSHGYDPTVNTAILWEGVTYYLPRPALEQTLTELQALAACHAHTNSQVWLFLDYMLQVNTVDKGHTNTDPLWRLNVQQADALGTSFLSGFEDVETEMAKYGFKVKLHTTYDEIEADYFSTATIDPKLSVFVEPNTTSGHNEPYLNLVECLFE